MTAITEHYKTPPILRIYGGMDFDYSLQVIEVASTQLDGKITDLHRIGPIDFTGWTAFAGQLRSFDGLYAETCSIGIDGPPDEGTLYIRGIAAQTWRLQQAGVRGGTLTIKGGSPSGQRFLVAPCQFVLEPGSTDPLTPSVTDWTVLR